MSEQMLRDDVPPVWKHLQPMTREEAEAYWASMTPDHRHRFTKAFHELRERMSTRGMCYSDLFPGDGPIELKRDVAEHNYEA